MNQYSSFNSEDVRGIAESDLLKLRIRTEFKAPFTSVALRDESRAFNLVHRFLWSASSILEELSEEVNLDTGIS